MSDKVIEINLTDMRDTPNPVQEQAGFQGATEQPKVATMSLANLPIKKAMGLIGAKKILFGTLQRVGEYSGNRVLQNRIDNTVAWGTGLVAFTTLAIVNPFLGAGYMINKAIDLGFAEADQRHRLKVQNLDAEFERKINNTNLNNNRFMGGHR